MTRWTPKSPLSEAVGFDRGRILLARDLQPRWDQTCDKPMTGAALHEMSDIPPVDAPGPGDEAPGETAMGGRRETEDRVFVEDLTPFSVTPEMSVRQAIAQIDEGSEGFALVIEGDGRLMATLTDGDVRRALLQGLDLDLSLESFLRTESARPWPEPITAPLGSSPVTLLRLMGERLIRHIPLVDDRGRVVALALLSRFVRQRELPLKAVIMAGGLGTRLRPLTEATPKPMLPVGDRPLLQRIVEQLGEAGIRSIDITTHYQPEKIRQHFGEGSSFGALVRCSHESEPLGTAGALRNLQVEGTEPLLVINGDVLTTVNFRAMFDYHRDHGAGITVGVRHYAMEVPYGVVDCDGPFVKAIREKPEIGFFVNAGIYLVEPEVCALIPENRRFDMTDLIARVIETAGRAVSFPIHEYWLDIGRHGDYEQAQEDLRAGEVASKASA